ncbi:DUF5666 domain-containing protein [Halioxenophilus sp. WMMB6]|uniref:DUF5666 domain-containing protein n=1 Tax=Halioxenophilus sp. WMMB6 TaxID=3073815 RepID=UPI00295EA779|nr:DUF5666 domain-containing protein [Halioxenophilus sp. WMMB6]
MSVHLTAHWRFLTTISLTMSLCACNFQLGGDPNSDGTSSGSDGGASIGVLTDAGALEVNYDSDFSLSVSANVYIDGEEADSSDLAKGMVASFVLSETVPSNLSSGTATEIRANHLLIGPVTQLQPLMVLTNEVTVTEDTEIDGIKDDDIANLSLGDVVRVSGYSNRAGGVLASRVDAPTGGSSFWKITGNVENLVSNDSFLLNDQTVQFNGLVADCSPDISNGDWVEVTASPLASFTAGDAVSTTLSITCVETKLPELSNNDSDINSLPAEMEDIITDFGNTLGTFYLGDQEAEVTSSTQYYGGSSSDMVIGAKVEVEGSVNLSSGILTADTVIFHERRIYLEAPLNSSQVTVDTSVELFQVNITANRLLVEDDLIVSSGVADTQVRLWGFVDQDQNPYAIRMEAAGTMDDQDITVQGPISRVSSSTFDIMGISVAGSAAAGIVASLAEEDLVRVENSEVNGSASITGGTITQIEQ